SAYADHRDLPSFPTRRSSDLCFELPQPFRDFMFSSPREVKLSKPWPIPADSPPGAAGLRAYRLGADDFSKGFFTAHSGIWRRALDRKSTRLNSSHVEISYAVF